MYEFRYNFIKKNVDAELLFTDTDSVTYETKSKDGYEEFSKSKHCLTLAIFQNTQVLWQSK